MSRAVHNEISPEQAMLEGHELWQRFLNEWKAEAWHLNVVSGAQTRDLR